MLIRYIVYLLPIILAGMNQGCGATRASWYTDIPESISSLPGWSLLDSVRVHVVIDNMEPRAEEILDAKPLVQITESQAREFLGRSLSTISGNRYYLVRSVAANSKTGDYYISTLDGYLWVHHASLGRGPKTMKRRALIIQLADIPNRVYVTCSTAE